ncbi:hypothetical protein ABRT01_02630 [Lentibacillus sp. L22]|uniref:hypothetical protein n=1 Tax=Lentibacillus sp. L22 TaxID=3163028 RepID=UPI003466BE2E
MKKISGKRKKQQALELSLESVDQMFGNSAFITKKKQSVLPKFGREEIENKGRETEECQKGVIMIGSLCDFFHSW